VIDASVAKVTVRPARLDRPLQQGALDPGYSDPRLEQMIREATEQAREAAQAQGYAAGWMQGRQAAAAEAQVQAAAAAAQLERERQAVVAEMRQLLGGLAQAANVMSQRSASEWSEVADVLGEGALQLAQALLARELNSVDDALMLNVRAALQQLADPAQAVVHLHPQDAAMIKDVPDGVRIVPDPAVPVGGVVVLTPAQRLRMDLPEALASAQEVLRS
jgi:flagellar assembly protein FliH